MLTGDNRRTAEAVARQVGTDESMADVLPQRPIISVIVPQCVQAYLINMASPFFRLLILIALLMVPSGMAGAPALAQTAPDVAGHCTEGHEPSEEPAERQTHCVACSALPALDAPATPASLLLHLPPPMARIQSLAVFEPEIVTPPPKHS